MSDEPKFSFFRLSITPFSSKDGSGQKSSSISPADTAPAFFFWELQSYSFWQINWAALRIVPPPQLQWQESS